MAKLIQISQLNATPDGTYVNGEVRAVLSRAVEPKNPKAPWKCMLSDSTGVIEASCWGGGISHWEGKQVVLSGKGMKIQEYKGTKTLSVGDKVDISFGGAPGTAAQQDDQIPGDPAPQTAPQRSGMQSGQPHHPAPKPAPTASGTPASPIQKNGQTVGMAVKAAVDIWLATDCRQGGQLWNEAAPRQVEQIAREIIDISERIQSGEPAESEPPF